MIFLAFVRMAFEDFCTFFTNATVCHVLSKSIFSLRKRWHVFKHNYQWTPGTNAGGCVENRSTFLKNPQVQLDFVLFYFILIFCYIKKKLIYKLTQTKKGREDKTREKINDYICGAAA